MLHGCQLPRSGQLVSPGAGGGAIGCVAPPATFSSGVFLQAAARAASSRMESVVRMTKGNRGKLRSEFGSAVHRVRAHVCAAVRAIAHRDAPRLAADLAVLDVLLRGAAAGVERNLVRL